MRVWAQFAIEIIYGQVSLFDASLDRPYNDWTDQHVKQGFAWRDGSVSFSVDEDGRREILVGELAPASSYGEPATMIEVPFSVPQAGFVEVGSVNETRSIEVAPGQYQIRYYDFCLETNRSSLVLTFQRCNMPIFKVLRKGGAFYDGSLLTNASPA